MFKEEKKTNEIKRFEVKWKDTDIDVLKFIFENTIIRVQDTFDDHTKISSKLNSILLVMISITTLLGGFIIKEIDNAKPNDAFIATSIVGIMLSTILIIALIILSLSKSFKPPGRVPSNVMLNKLFKNDLIEENERLKFIIYKELVYNENKINHNQQINTTRLKRIDLIFISIICILSVMIIMLILLKGL